MLYALEDVSRSDWFEGVKEQDPELHGVYSTVCIPESIPHIGVKHVSQAPDSDSFGISRPGSERKGEVKETEGNERVILLILGKKRPVLR